MAGIHNLLKPTPSRNEQPEVRQLAAQGVRGDDTMAHLTSGEMVIPQSFQTPGIMSIISNQMRRQGVNPVDYMVGSRGAKRNPFTGAQMFPEPGMGADNDHDRDDQDDDRGRVGTPGDPSGGFRDAGPYGGVGRGFAGTFDRDADREERKARMRKASIIGALLGGPVGAGLGALYGHLSGRSGVSVGTFDPSRYESAGGEGAAYQPFVPQPVPTQAPPAGISGVTNILPITPEIDYANYAYGPEQLMYPWVTPEGTSYGQYPISLTGTSQ